MIIRPLIATMALTLALSGISMAQERPERGERGERWERFQRERAERGEGAERGERPDPQQFRQRIQDQLKQQLQASDEEWEILQPKIERVQAATLGARGGMGMMAGRGGAGGPGARGGESELATASRELRTALQSETATEAEIAERLAAYRAAREKAQAELEAARTDLRDLLTERQEAVLVLMAVLE